MDSTPLPSGTTAGLTRDVLRQGAGEPQAGLARGLLAGLGYLEEEAGGFDDQMRDASSDGTPGRR